MAGEAEDRAEGRAAMGLGGWAAVGRALESSPASIPELMGPGIPLPAGKGQAPHPGGQLPTGQSREWGTVLLQQWWVALTPRNQGVPPPFVAARSPSPQPACP